MARSPLFCLLVLLASTSAWPASVRAQLRAPGSMPLVEVPRALVPAAEQTADSLLAAMDLDGAYRVLVTRLDVAPRDPEALWRAVRAAVGLGILADEHDQSLEWMRVADAYGERLLAERPDDVEALAWASAARGRRAIAESSPRTKARLGEEVWALTDRLLSQEPAHPLGNDVRGKLHYEVLRLSKGERFLARVFLGGNAVGHANWELAEIHLRRAVAGDPGMVLFQLDLGETYRAQGKDLEAAEAFRGGLAVPDRYPVDAKLKSSMQRQIEEMAGSPGSH